MRPFLLLCFFISIISLPSAGQDATEQNANDTNALGRIDETVTLVKGKVEGMEEGYLATQSTVDKLSKIKLSGYLQAQLRYALNSEAARNTSTGAYFYPVGDFTGGAFPAYVSRMMHVRSAYIKFMYDMGISQMVIQLDCLPPSGAVNVKDAYIYFTEPWLKSFGLKMGLFDRPFGYEISYSSSVRESPERSRVIQTLFPGERDIGVELDLIPSTMLSGFAQYFTIKGGAFTGNGINTETDNRFDGIGRAGFSLPWTDMNLSLDGGVSLYRGKVLSINDTLFEMTDKAFTSAKGYKNAYLDRTYQGFDAQLYKDLPVFGGFSLKGEYVQGKQPGSSGSSKSPSSNSLASSPYYMRDFLGYYMTFVQNINPVNSQVVVKYDLYDPNTKVKTDEINATNKLKTADIAFTTIGAGLVYYWKENIRFSAYVDNVRNEKVNKDVSPYYADDVHDNVFTFRVQYKF